MDDLSSITSSVELITPERAAAWLQNVVANGHIDQTVLRAFERDMREHRWLLNGAPIVLSTDGRVLDGRTRLHACVNSQTAFESLIIFGIKSDTFETIDSIRKRSLADILSIRKEKHGRSLGSALRIIWHYQSGLVPGNGKSPTPTTLLTILEQNPEIRDSVIPSLRAMPLLPHGCAIAIHYLASKIHGERADQFIAQIGEPLSADGDHPVVQLRSALSSLRTQGGSRKQTYLLAITIKAFNAFYRGKAVKHLRYGEKENFPRFEKELDWGPLSRASPNKSLPALDHNAKDIRVTVAMVTPEMAESLLEARGPNRHVSAVVINKYARDMTAGRWRLNGQTIKISRDGRLLDGQHRLEAAKKSKHSFPAVIVEGLSPETFSSLDTGQRRVASDVLRERGESHTISLASALRWLWMIQNGVILAANSSPTNGELLELLETYPKIRESLKHVMAIREIMGAGIAAALHCTFSSKNEGLADEFFDRLIDGVQLAEQSPVRHLRERLLRTRASHRVRLAEAERVAITIKAWNAFREDRPVQLLLWRNRGVARESLPLVI